VSGKSPDESREPSKLRRGRKGQNLPKPATTAALDSEPDQAAVPAATVKHPLIELNITPALGKPGRFLAVAMNGKGELHRDTIDLNSAVSRGRFVNATLGRAFAAVLMDDWPDEVREDLEKRLLAIAAIPPGITIEAAATPSESVDPRIKALAEM